MYRRCTAYISHPPSQNLFGTKCPMILYMHSIFAVTCCWRASARSTAAEYRICRQYFLGRALSCFCRFPHYRNAGASSMWTRRGWKLRCHAVEAAIVGVLIGKPRRCSACLGGYTRRSPVSDGSAHITSLTEPTLWPSLLILAHIQW